MPKNRLIIEWSGKTFHITKRKESNKCGSLDKANKTVFNLSHWNMKSATYYNEFGTATELVGTL